MDGRRPAGPIDLQATRRRAFLRGAAGVALVPLVGGCAGSPPPATTAADTSANANANATPGSSSGSIAVDMHNHVYPVGTEPHPQRGPRPGGGPPGGGPPGGGSRGGGPPRDEPETGPDPILADELEQSGFTAVCASFVLDFAANVSPGDARTNLLRWFSAVDAELEKGHLRRALTMKDLEIARASGAPTIIQSVEGAHFIEGDLARIDEVYARGLRHLQLLHERDDMVKPLGDTNTAVAHLGGLTPIGADVVKACDRLGILVDLAHASHETVVAALKVSTRPMIVSHTNLDTWAGKDARMAEMMKPRLISKEHAKVLADAGGVVGVWTHLAGSLTELVESVKAMADAIGVDHVGIGSDTDLLSRRTGHATNKAWPGLTGGLWNAVAGEMRRQGFGADDIAKIGGGNYCRVFDKVTARAS